MPSPLALLREAGLVRHNLILFALLTAAFNGIVTASIGAWLAQSYTSHIARRKAVETIADLVNERETRARMVLSSVRRNADLDEIRTRKHAYDDAFVEWNKKVQGGVLAIREAMGADDTTPFETLLQTKLMPAVGEMDTCMTKVYDLRVKGAEVQPYLDACQRPELNAFILDCGGAIVDELYRFTELRLLPFVHSKAKNMTDARERILKVCGKPPVSPVPFPLPSAVKPAETTIPPTATVPAPDKK